MKVALVYDRVNKFGGAERVLLALKKLYPDAPLYTLVYSKPTARWAKVFKIVPTFFNKIKFLRRRHEILAPLSALAFETFNLTGFDVVISVTSDQAKAVITRPETLHLCYCLTPTRYLYTAAAEYRRHFRLKWLFDKYLPSARLADQIYASRPDAYLSISREVAGRVKEYYGRSSEVIYPPINYDFFKEAPRHKKRDYYLVVSRLVPYKKVDLVIEAFNRLNLPLTVVGIGSEEEKLKSLARSNIDFVGLVDDTKLRRLYTLAKAVIYPQIEDFGLVPLEAAAAGTPTLALAQGGAAETIIDNFTGLFYKEQTSGAIEAAVHRFESGHHQISAKRCTEQAALFSEDRFISAFSAKVNSLWKEHAKSMSLSSPGVPAPDFGRFPAKKDRNNS